MRGKIIRTTVLAVGLSGVTSCSKSTDVFISGPSTIVGARVFVDGTEVGMLRASEKHPALSWLSFSAASGRAHDVLVLTAQDSCKGRFYPMGSASIEVHPSCGVVSQDEW